MKSSWAPARSFKRLSLRRLDSSLGGVSQKRFQLSEDLLDGIEIGRVRWPEEQARAGGADGSPQRCAFVAAMVFEDDDIAGLYGRHQNRLDIGKETHAVDWPIEDARCGDAILAQSCEERQCLPVAVRNLCDQPRAAQRTPVGSRHVGLGPGLVDEDQALSIDLVLMAPPALTTARNVQPILLAGVQAFFELMPTCSRTCHTA